MHRRAFLKAAAAGSAAVVFGPSLWRPASAAPAKPGPGPYGPLQAADANGIALPAGFSSRVVAVSGTPVQAPGVPYQWHGAPDGGATFPTPDGGWVYVSNSEIPAPLGGAGALRFDANGNIAGAYRILATTDSNCAGGPTPWGTWLSCEESLGKAGHVWECNPFAAGQGIERPAMGTFAHEAVAVDPLNKRLYLTEDDPEGRLFRFTPASYPDLSSGILEAAGVGAGGAVTWVPADAATVQPRPAGSTSFDGGEGIWFDSGHIYFSTKGDNRVWDLEIGAQRISILYDAAEIGPSAPLTGVDNVVMSKGGDLYVAEDGGNLEIVVISATHEVAPVMRITNQKGGGIEDGGTEITGPAFSPDGTRLYFSSQRATTGGAPGPGITYEVTGPFRTVRPTTSAPPATITPPAKPAAAAPATAQGEQLSATGLDDRLGLAGLGLIGAAALAAAAVRSRATEHTDPA